MSRVHVSPEVLKWAAERSGKSEIIHNDFPTWFKWINNESQPTFKQLERLSIKTSTPLGFFLLESPPVESLPIPHYRTLDDSMISGPSVDLLDSVQTLLRRQDWVRDLLVEQGAESLHFVSKANTNSNPKEVAKDIRSELGLKNGWASDCKTWEEAHRMLLTRIESLRIFVVVNGIVGNNTHRKLNVKEFRGFVLVDEYAPFIFINGADGKGAQMFTLAHELAHVWFGSSAAFDLDSLHPANDKLEKICNEVAAEFLVPENELRERWSKVKRNVDSFSQVSRYFKVSEVVVARRALDLKLITKSDFFDFYENRFVNQQLNMKKATGGDFYANQKFRVGQRFAEAVFRSTAEGKLLYREAYQLTGLSGRTFSEFATLLGFRGEI
jgi:Zn-dependent peptidase ImmA (M78 family)